MARREERGCRLASPVWLGAGASRCAEPPRLFGRDAEAFEPWHDRLRHGATKDLAELARGEQAERRVVSPDLHLRVRASSELALGDGEPKRR